MNSKTLWAAFFALSAFGPRSSGVWAQSGMATCPAGWEWNENSLGQDPCLMSSMLDASCRGVGSYTVPPLNSSQNYVPPQRDSTADLRCDCDTVMYSLYMACSSCQGAVVYSWTRWIPQCDNGVYISQYPIDIPQGIAIPQWAFINVTNLPGQMYNDTVAIAIGRNPEELPKPVNTISLGGSSSSLSGTSSSPGPTNTSDGGKSNTGAIVGGVVGGVAGLIALAGAAFFFVKWRKQSGGNQLPPTPSQAREVSEYYKAQPNSPSLSPTTGNLPYNPYYNPEDPSTFPPTMGDGQSSFTYVTQLSGPHGQGRGRYSGVPEV